MLYMPPPGSTDPNASYVGANIPGGSDGSRVPKSAVEAPQREIVAIIKAAQALGLDAPSATDLTQMLKAVRSGLLNRFPATGTPDAITIAPSPAYVGLVEGMRFRVKIPGTAASTLTAPTFTVNSIAPVAILKRSGAALAVGDLTAGTVVEFEIDAAGKARVMSAVANDGGSAAYNAFVPVYFKETAGTDTWAPPGPGTYWVKVVGSGGSGGGSTTLDCGGPGGGGGRSEGPVTIADTSSRTILVGAGGAPVPINTTVAGNAGSSSSALGLSATGGGGGAAMTGSNSVPGGYGGQGSGGLFNYAGQAGQASTNNTQANNYPNAGGAVGFTGGNCTQQNSVNGSTGPSGNGPTPGAGGSGGYVSNAGFKGADGAVYIYKLA